MRWRARLLLYAASARSQLAGLRRLLVPERYSARHQAGERRELQHGSRAARQRLAE